jgi:hypothetical protein
MNAFALVVIIVIVALVPDFLNGFNDAGLQTHPQHELAAVYGGATGRSTGSFTSI